MARFAILKNQDGVDSAIAFVCPGCNRTHCFEFHRWKWDGNLEKPTCSPSLLVHPYQRPDGVMPRCHLFLRNGVLEFLGDCEHELAGRTAEPPDWDEWWGRVREIEFDEGAPE